MTIADLAKKPTDRCGLLTRDAEVCLRDLGHRGRCEAAPGADEPRLYTRAELPAWVRPEKERGRLYAFRSFFYGRPGTPKIRQAMFAIGPGGAVFVDLVIHTPEGKSQLRAGDETALPGCVLIAVGVEQIRIARGGR